MSAVEFVLIPKEMYLPQRPVVEQILYNPNISATGKQLSILQRFKTQKKLPEEPEPIVVPAKTLKETVFDSLVTLTDAQKRKSDLIYDSIETSPRLSLDNNGQIQIDNSPTGLFVGTFLYELQQPTKKLDKVYEPILKDIGIAEHLVANKFAKQIIVHEWIKFSTPTKRTGAK